VWWVAFVDGVAWLRHCKLMFDALMVLDWFWVLILMAPRRAGGGHQLSYLTFETLND
jgi:hypothetical protein